MVYLISYLVSFAMVFLVWNAIKSIYRRRQKPLVSSATTLPKLKDDLALLKQSYDIVNYLVKYNKKGITNIPDSDKDIIKKMIEYKLVTYINDKQSIKPKRNILKKLNKQILSLRSAICVHESIVTMTYHLEYDSTDSDTQWEGKLVLNPPPPPSVRKQKEFAVHTDNVATNSE